MATHLKNKGTHFVMEVSSHAIHQKRVEGIDFTIKALTNITQDHLDYHHTLSEYTAVKHSFLRGAPHIVRPQDFEKETLEFTPQLLGDYNIKNLQCAQLILKKCGLTQQEINTHLATIPAPPGRFEPLIGPWPFTLIIDFAHTPDALENVLKTAKKLAIENKGRLISVFGCGGDRDTSKRSQMGRISSNLADITIITSDNPRSESPEEIIKDVQKGVLSATKTIVQVDRKEAIHHAVQIAEPHDIIVLAGKGHETYQIVRDIKMPFDEKKIAKDALKKYGYIH